MVEFEALSPREATTGLTHTPCLVFGNGVEIETVVFARTTKESEHRARDGRLVKVLPIRIGEDLEGTDVVNVHFIPKTSQVERANDPLLVLEEERPGIMLDCLRGFIALAGALKNDQVLINGHKQGEDFYLFADTNLEFAGFLERNCGFRGAEDNEWVWIRKSEFVAEENVERMKQAHEAIKTKIPPVSQA
jgi:hypothetical protein